MIDFNNQNGHDSDNGQPKDYPKVIQRKSRVAPYKEEDDEEEKVNLK